MIRNMLFGNQSPYAGFDPSPYPEDVQGWGSDDPILTEAIRALRPRTICEVGSWKGRSAINMAAAVKELGLDTEIVCVDTWLGSPEHWLRKKEPNHYPSLLIEHGRPQIYNLFLANVIRAGAENIITPFPNTSDAAALVFKKRGCRFDLIYIDAAHGYEAVKRDIANYYELLSDDGLMIGDDYTAWPGVARAAKEFAGDRGVSLFSRRNKFLLSKGASATFCKPPSGNPATTTPPTLTAVYVKDALGNAYCHACEDAENEAVLVARALQWMQAPNSQAVRPLTLVIERYLDVSPSRELDLDTLSCPANDS